jgi:hypothetical protein
MGMLYNLWNNKFVEKRTKYLFFLDIPVNLLLWGCESWALRESLLDKLNAFIHKSICRILGINMEQVKEQRIKNEQVQEQFFDKAPHPSNQNSGNASCTHNSSPSQPTRREYV